MRPDLEPDQLTPEERSQEVAALVAVALLRLHQRAAVPTQPEQTLMSGNFATASKEPLELSTERSVTGHAGRRSERSSNNGESLMKLNVAKEVAALERMTPTQLRSKYAAVFGEGTNTRNKTWLVRRIIWRLQANAEGGLSERARQRAEELAENAEIRTTPPSVRPAQQREEIPQVEVVRLKSDERIPAPGTVITRQYKGRMLSVVVREKGFEFEGEVYGPLSAVAKAITEAHYNGFLFFNLTKKEGAA